MTASEAKAIVDQPCEWYGRDLGKHDWVATVDGWNLCAKCKREYKPVEPAPKEGEKPKCVCWGNGFCNGCEPAQVGGDRECVKCGHWFVGGTVTPCPKCEYPKVPAQVESGDGLPPLPPLDKEWEAEVHGLTRDGRHDMDRTRAVLHCRERQLKASLQREKDLRELLRECEDAVTVLVYERANDITGKHYLDLSKRLKAAVTGE